MPTHIIQDHLHNEHFTIDSNDTVKTIFKAPEYTTAERDALSAQDGMIIFNTTSKRFQGFEDGGWVNFID